MTEYEDRLYAVIIISIIVGVSLLLWHPWTDVPQSFLDSLETEINDELGYGTIALEKEWSPFGTRVNILARLNTNLNDITSDDPWYKIAYYDINLLFGREDYIHLKSYYTSTGYNAKLPIWW